MARGFGDDLLEKSFGCAVAAVIIAPFAVVFLIGKAIYSALAKKSLPSADSQALPDPDASAEPNQEAQSGQSDSKQEDAGDQQEESVDVVDISEHAMPTKKLGQRDFARGTATPEGIFEAIERVLPNVDIPGARWARRKNPVYGDSFSRKYIKDAENYLVITSKLGGDYCVAVYPRHYGNLFLVTWHLYEADDDALQQVERHGVAMFDHQEKSNFVAAVSGAIKYALQEASAPKPDVEDQIKTFVRRYFPFLQKPFSDFLKEGLPPTDAIGTALVVVEADAVTLGATKREQIPVLIPQDLRRQHLYVVGKSGSGKSTLLQHLIHEDVQAGHTIAVIGPEREQFTEEILPFIPDDRLDDLIYFAPGVQGNGISFNPLELDDGDDQDRAAGELFEILRRSFTSSQFGPRMSQLLQNTLSMLVGRPGATLRDIKRVLEDASVRASFIETTDDDYVREFWLETYPSFPKDAHLPLVTRLDEFLRPRAIRKALCQPSGFSFRKALEGDRILLFDLSGLAPGTTALVGQMLLCKFQLELLRRERISKADRRPCYVYADEFQTWAGTAEQTWQELLSRGRRYGLALTLAHQHPSQLSPKLQHEIFGNVASIAAFGLSAADATAIRGELRDQDGDDPAQPLPVDLITRQGTGEVITRIGSDAFATLSTTRPPLEPPGPAAERAARAREWSWRKYGGQPSKPKPTPGAASSPPPSDVPEADDFG